MPYDPVQNVIKRSYVLTGADDTRPGDKISTEQLDRVADDLLGGVNNALKETLARQFRWNPTSLTLPAKRPNGDTVRKGDDFTVVDDGTFLNRTFKLGDRLVALVDNPGQVFDGRWTLISILKGEKGDSAYQIAVNNGFVGTVEDWLDSLIGRDGDDGDSAYQVAVENGFVGTEAEWLESLKGKDGVTSLTFSRLSGVFSAAPTAQQPSLSQLRLPVGGLDVKQVHVVLGNGAHQVPGNDYTITDEGSSTLISLSSALQVGDAYDVWISGGTQGPAGLDGDDGIDGKDGEPGPSGASTLATARLTGVFSQVPTSAQPDLRTLRFTGSGYLTSQIHVVLGNGAHQVPAVDYTIARDGDATVITFTQPNQVGDAYDVWASGGTQGAEGETGETGKGVIAPVDFGAVLDGITDDTDAIRAFHAFCNETNSCPDYSGVKKFAVRANADIVLNTSVDFFGAEIVLLGAMIQNASDATTQVAFRVIDTARPVETGNMTVTGANFGLDSMTCCADFAKQDGYAAVYLNEGTSLPVIPGRTRDSVLPYRIVHRTFANGKTQHPLPVNGSGVTRIYYRKRANSLGGKLTISGFTFDVGSCNSQCLFKIERNQVTVRDVVLKADNGRPSQSYNRIFYPEDCSEFQLADAHTTSNDGDASDGSYDVLFRNVADFVVRNVSCAGGTWGCMATHNCNGMVYNDCDLDRIDVHSYGCNIEVKGCRLRYRSIFIGQGGGYLKVHDCVYYFERSGFGLVQGRSDYCGHWDGGEIVVSDIQIIPLVFGDAFGVPIINFTGSTAVGSTAMVCDMPRLIKVDNVSVLRGGVNAGTTWIVTPVALEVFPGSLGVVAPANIEVSRISCVGRWRMYNRVSYADMLKPKIDGNLIFSVKDCLPTLNSTVPTVFVPPASGLPAESKALSFRISGVENLNFDCPGVTHTSSDVEVQGGTVSRLAVGASIPIIMSGSRLKSPIILAGETVAPVGGPLTSGRYTYLTGCQVTGAFNLSTVAALSGVVASADVTLPNGVTRSQAFMGWADASLIGA